LISILFFIWSNLVSIHFWDNLSLIFLIKEYAEWIVWGRKLVVKLSLFSILFSPSSNCHGGSIDDNTNNIYQKASHRKNINLRSVENHLDLRWENWLTLQLFSLHSVSSTSCWMHFSTDSHFCSSAIRVPSTFVLSLWRISRFLQFLTMWVVLSFD
jgi:hypothetical protein